MGYNREITNLIVECWGLGLSAEETREAIQRKKEVFIGLATVYRHRHSLTAQQIIDELIRKQLRDIAKADDPDLRMKYRDKILEKLLPMRIEQLSFSVSKEEKNVTVNVEHLTSEAAGAIARNYLDSEARQLRSASNPTVPSDSDGAEQ